MNQSEFIVQKLVSLGLSDVFSIVGGHSLFINKAFADEEKIKVTYFHHEQSASMAADAYFRLKGKPAIVNISAGPAALNTLNGVYGSYVDSIPVIYLSGQPKSSQQVTSTGIPLRQFGDQEFDRIAEVVKLITKYSIKFNEQTDINFEIRKAYDFAIGGRPGPVWIDIPMDVQNNLHKNNLNVSEKTEVTYKNNLQFRKKLVTTEQLDIIYKKIKAAKRPLIYAGPNVRTYGAYNSFQKIIKNINIPVVTSWNGHDLINTDNELFVGRPGLRGERSGNWSVYTCDFLLVIGEHLSIRQIGYQNNKYSPNSFKVMVDQDLNELNKPSLDIDLCIFGELEDFLEKLFLKIQNLDKDKWVEWRKKTRHLWNKYSPQESIYNYTYPINPYHFLIKLFKNLGGKESIVVGNGISVVGAFQTAVIKEGQNLFQNYGCASMGYDLPASIGAWLGKSKKVICITGDGSIQLNIQELQTLISLKININIFVINNGGYDSIRQSQIMAFGSNVEHHGINPISGLQFPDLDRIANAYKIKYRRIEDVNNAEQVIKESLNDYICICEIFVDQKQLFEPKVATSKNEDGSIKSGELINMKPFLEIKEIKDIINDLTNIK